MWKVESIVSKGDYNYAIVWEHPYATKNGYVLEHRIVVENTLGRLLNHDEVVHHKNNNKKDNRLENLQIMSLAEHARLHGIKGRKFLQLKCPNCKSDFLREKRQVKSGTTFCSRKCNGYFNRMLQLHGKTPEMNLAISENIVSEFISHDNSEQTANNRMRRGHTPDSCNAEEMVQPANP